MSAPVPDPVVLAGLLAEPARLRVVAAVALGAHTDAEVAEAAQVAPRDSATALRRLAAGGVLTRQAGGWAVAYGALAELARSRPAGPDGSGLAPFVADGRLRSLPAQQQRRLAVLEHVVAEAFAAYETYAEPEVDARLQAWCEGGEVDRVALRRYLVDARLLTRREGRYWRTTATTPPLGLGEQRVRELGLA